MAPDAADRRLNRPLDRMENQGDDYRRRLREGFLREARRAENNVQVIAADRPVEVVRSDIWRTALQVLRAGNNASGKPSA
jgi:thymidylate kinase